MRKRTFAAGIILLALFALAGAFALLMHTPWGRQKVADSFAKELAKSGWQIHIGQSEGSLLDELTLTSIQIETPQKDQIQIGSLRTKLSLMRLLKKEISFQGLFAKDIKWTLHQNSQQPVVETKVHSEPSPFSLSFSNIQLDRVQLPHCDSLADFQGFLSIGRYQKKMRLDLSGSFHKDRNTKASVSLLKRKSGQTRARIALKTPSLHQMFSCWISIPKELDSQVDLKASIHGKWDDFTALMKQETPTQSLEGNLSGKILLHDELPWAGSNWTVRSPIKWTKTGDWHLPSFEISSNKTTKAEGSLVFSSTGTVKESFTSLLLPSLKKAQLAPIEGDWQATLQWKQKRGFLEIGSNAFSWDTLTLKNPKIEVQMEQQGSGWTGELHAKGLLNEQSVEAESFLSWNRATGMQIEDILFTSALAKASGEIEILPNFLFDGILHAQLNNLHEFNAFNLNWPLYGKGCLDLRCSVVNGEQRFEIDGWGTDLFYHDFSAERFFLYADIIPSTNQEYFFEIENGSFQRLYIDSLSLESESFDWKNWSFRLLGEGEWKGPYQIEATASLDRLQDQTHFSINDLNGTLFGQPLTLAEKCMITVSPNHLAGKGIDLSIGAAHLLADFEKSATTGYLTLILDHFPLDYLLVNHEVISSEGLLHVNAHINEKAGKTEGNLHVQMEEISLTSLGCPTFHDGTSTLDASLNNQRLALQAKMQMGNTPLFNLQANLPLDIHLTSLSSEWLQNDPISGSLQFHGRVEDILNFFNLGANRLEGLGSCHFTLQGTAKHPQLHGTCKLKQGVYENYYTGTELSNIDALLEAKGPSLILSSFSAQDGQEKGTLSLQGEMKLSSKEHFPFIIDGEFTRMQATDISWMKMEAGGSIHIQGDAHSAKVSGQALVVEGDLSIPEKLPPSLPNLPVKYINAPKPVAVEEAKVRSKGRYPIRFDYRVHAPDGIFISGRGLSSEWKGDFDLGGTYTNIQAKGQLDLLAGDFIFSGRVFELTEGSLTFTGQPHEMPFLNLAGIARLQNLSILARLKGFLNAPQLTFQSSPPLPMGSILSYLLFGQDLSEINALQAAQLVSSLTTLSGQGPDFLGGAKRSIGVDRLRIIANPVGPEGAESYALQVGKYVTKGILVSVSQGIKSGSMNLAVEVDLSHGFMFEARSMQETQQGKFSIKWHHNY